MSGKPLIIGFKADHSSDCLSDNMTVQYAFDCVSSQPKTQLDEFRWLISRVYALMMIGAQNAILKNYSTYESIIDAVADQR